MLRITKPEFNQKILRAQVSVKEDLIIEYARGQVESNQSMEVGYFRQVIEVKCPRQENSCCENPKRCLMYFRLQRVHEYELDHSIPMVHVRDVEHQMRKHWCVTEGMIPTVIENDDQQLTDDEVCELVAKIKCIASIKRTPSYFFKIKNRRRKND